MKTTARYTKGRGDASVHARTRVFAWEDHQLIELDVVGILDSEQHFRILATADEAEVLAHQLVDAAAKIRAAAASDSANLNT
ncbi:hypothetical protein [Burkholderia ambifaria]|uniref:hypothetical protein n=1 Tax=Burkholderia ambifaria TaxID=152480 RepID=UPI00158862EA|nr:hypothetical protein [Burkholderia ambifaria]